MKLIYLKTATILGAIALFSCKPGEVVNKELAELETMAADIELRRNALDDSLDILEKLIEEKDTTIDKNYPLVALDSVRSNSISEDVMFQGSVEADKTIMLGPESQGVIKAIYVKEGQYVSRGKTIAMLDSEILQKNVKEVEKSLELAEYLLEKQENLKKQGIGAEANLVQAKNQVESLKTRLSTLKTQASKSRVVAPFSGYVDEVFTKLGEMASPGMPVVRLVNIDKVRVKAEVSEAYLMDIQKGDKVTLNFPSIDMVITDATVSSVGKFINPTNRTFPIQVELRNRDKKIIPNLIAEVKVQKDFTSNAIVIPSNAVLTDSKGMKYVYVFVDGKSYKKVIEELYVKGDRTQISENSEVKPGDIIITKGASAVSDGQQVQELKN